MVNLAAVTANPGGLVEFIGPATVGAGGGNVVSNTTITTTASGNSAFVGGSGAAFFDANFATVGLYDYAAATSASSPFTVVGGSQISGFYTAASGGNPGTGGNLDVTGNITGWSAQPYLTSMRFNTGLGANIAVSASNFGSVLTLGDILVTPNVGAYNVTYNNGGFRPGGGSGTYAGPLVIWQNNPAGDLILNTTLNNSKTGAAAYVQAGPGTVSITGAGSGYTGQSYLNGGVTLIAGNGSLGAQATAAAVNLNGGTVVANGTFAMDNGGANLRPFNLLGNGGGLAATAGNTLTIDGLIGSATGTGPLVIGIPASSANGNVAGLLPGTGAGTANPTPVHATGTVVLTNANYYTGGTVLQTGTLNINGIYALGGGNYGGLTFNGGTLQYVTNFPGNNGSSDLTSIGTAGITLAAGGGTIDLNGNFVTYAGSIGNGGNGSLLVKSSVTNGMLILLGANNYTGSTTITNATLLANNASGSATGTGNLTMQSGGVLEGSGSLGGSVTVAAGATFAPGNPLGTLTIGGNLTLAGGSKTFIRVQHSPLTNNAASVGGTLTQGGALTVTNSGGTAFIAGDSFKVLGAAAYAGTFSSLSLPSLSSGLFWSTTRLAVDGTLGVVSSNAPAVNSVSLSNGNLVLQGTNGTPNWYYTVLSSTNLALPLAQWTVTITNFFDGSGHFTWTNTGSSSGPRQFYLIRVQ